MRATLSRGCPVRRRQVHTPALNADLRESSAEAPLGGLDPIAEDAAAETQDAYTANERALYLQGVRAGRWGGFVWGLLIGGLLVAGSFCAGWVSR